MFLMPVQMLPSSVSFLTLHIMGKKKTRINLVSIRGQAFISDFFLPDFKNAVLGHCDGKIGLIST